jgi:stalled ribosome alternative rescue factor ArfA
VKKPKTPKPRKIRRNPHARALANPLFRPKVEKGKDEYRRHARHRKAPPLPPPEEGEG